MLNRWFKNVLDAVFNRYEGAAYTPTRSHLPGSVQSARIDVSSTSRTELMRRSRYWEKNDPLYNRLADLFECYTVGVGLVLQPASSNADWNLKARQWFATWERYPDLTSRQTFGTIQSLISRAWFVDGEAFVLLTSGESGRPRIQLIEAHLIETPPEFKSKEGVSIVDGVAIDNNGRPTGYWVKGATKYTLVDESFMVHVFEPSRAGQYRSIPFCHAVMNDIHDLSDLQMLEMQRARQAAEVSNVIKTASGELSVSQARRARIRVAGTTETAEPGREQYYRDTFGASTRIMKSGDDFQQFRIESPSEATRALWLNLEEKICAGIGIPRILAYPGTMQGTVYRGALDMANSFFRSRSSVLADAFRRIYEYVISWAAANDPSMRGAPKDLLSVNIQPPRSVNVDVGRNSSAMLAELEAGATTLEDIYSALGKDWREQMRKVKSERDYIAELGLTFGQQQPKEPNV